MRFSILLQLFKSLGVTLLVMGILFGVALGWSSEDGIPALWLAAAVAFISTSFGILAAAALRDMGNRPEHAPTAFWIGLGMSWFLMGLFSALVLLAGVVTLVPYVLWLVLHAAGQLGLQFVSFRRDDADEVARRTRINAGMTP